MEATSLGGDWSDKSLLGLAGGKCYERLSPARRCLPLVFPMSKTDWSDMSIAWHAAMGGTSAFTRTRQRKSELSPFRVDLNSSHVMPPCYWGIHVFGHPCFRAAMFSGSHGIECPDHTPKSIGSKSEHSHVNSVRLVVGKNPAGREILFELGERGKVVTFQHGEDLLGDGIVFGSAFESLPRLI